MDAQSLEWVIDKAAKVCGSQNELAKRVGATSSRMAQFKQGKRSVPDHVIERLAEVAGMKPADVWLLAQDARNPFRVERSQKAEGLNHGYFPLRALGKILAVLHVYNPSRLARRTSLPA